MKRKRLDRDIWTTITEKRYIQRIGQIGDFNGVVGLLYLDKVPEPSIWSYSAELFEACATGMKWLQLIPDNEDYMITAMINSDDKINVWYIDMIYGYGLSDDGVIYYDDLYLDIGIRPDGDYVIDDMDELAEALDEGDITRQQYDTAINTKDKLMTGILTDLDKLYSDCMQILSAMENSDCNKI